MMSAIEIFIKDTAPGGLYGEWAKKEERSEERRVGKEC